MDDRGEKRIAKLLLQIEELEKNNRFLGNEIDKGVSNLDKETKEGQIHNNNLQIHHIRGQISDIEQSAAADEDASIQGQDNSGMNTNEEEFDNDFETAASIQQAYDDNMNMKQDPNA